MTSVYVLIFLTLFAILGDTFVQKYIYYHINQEYSKPYYEKYVHRPRHHMNDGINMRALIDGDVNYCKIFIELIEYVYKEAPFYNRDLAQNLLSLFQSKITFNESGLKEGILNYKSKEDLDLLEVPENFRETYLFLMRGSQINENDSEGFPSLKSFFYSKDDRSNHGKLNLYTMPLEMIGSMFNKEAEEEMRLFRKNWVQKVLTAEEEKYFEALFKKMLHLEGHSYQDFVGFKVN